MLTLVGRIIPEYRKVSLDTEFRYASEELTFDFELKIDSSSFVAILNISHGLDLGLQILAVRAKECIDSVVDTYAFLNGAHLYAQVDLIEVGERMIVPVMGHRILVNFLKEQPTRLRAKQFTDVGWMYRDFQFVISDLNRALNSQNYQAIASGRAVDAIKKLISRGEGNEAAQWLCMRNSLNVDEGFLKFITDRAKGPRHGSRLIVDPIENEELMARAWILSERFVDWVLNDCRPLDRTIYPLLTGATKSSDPVRLPLGLRVGEPDSGI